MTNIKSLLEHASTVLNQVKSDSEILNYWLSRV